MISSTVAGLLPKPLVSRLFTAAAAGPVRMADSNIARKLVNVQKRSFFLISFSIYHLPTHPPVQPTVRPSACPHDRLEPLDSFDPVKSSTSKSPRNNYLPIIHS